MTETLQSLLLDLQSKFKTPTTGVGSLLAHPLSGELPHFIALNSENVPCVLLHATSRSETLVPPLRLCGIDVAYGVQCHLELPGGESREQVLTTITCTTSDPLERAFFLDTCESLLRIVGAAPDLQSVIAATEHLVNIFQRLANPTRQSITGMIGELLLLDLSPDPIFAIQAWRKHTDDRYDFSYENVRVEVKATQNRSRVHHLTYEQCAPPQHAIGILASVIVESAGGGQSLTELVQSIERRVGADREAVFRLLEVVAETLGDSLVGALGERYDRGIAEDSILYFDLRAVPAIRGDQPRGVSQVRFQSDLTSTKPIAIADAVTQYPLLGRLLES